MSFSSSAAPWGSPVVETIPLPPFASADEHRRFTRMLQFHLALIDVGGPAPPTVALSGMIDRPRRRRRFSPWLTEFELGVSLTTWFPAPWTPTALAEALERAGSAAPIGAGEHWS